jgi:hypothetical protein
MGHTTKNCDSRAKFNSRSTREDRDQDRPAKADMKPAKDAYEVRNNV